VSRHADGKLGAALGALTKALNATGISWMCIGGIAVIAQGVRRTTTDIDVTLRAEGVDLNALLRRLVRHNIRPRIDDAVAFAHRSQVLLLEHTTSGVELDVSLAWLSFEHEALAAPVTINFAGVTAPAAGPEDLMIYKLFAARPQDLKDAEALLLMHRPDIDLSRVRAVLEHLGEMSDDPFISRRLDEIDGRTPKARAKRPSRTPSLRPRKARKKT
jgi:hypothetical protein